MNSQCHILGRWWSQALNFRITLRPRFFYISDVMMCEKTTKIHCLFSHKDKYFFRNKQNSPIKYNKTSALWHLHGRYAVCFAVFG